MNVYKYELEITDEQTIRLPFAAEILDVQMQGRQCCLWALVDPQNEIEDRTIRIHGTGHPIPNGIKLKYIQELCEWFFNLVGYFNHYAFFVNKEWKKIGAFEEYDEAEIKCAFMHYWFHHKFHHFTMPVGMRWFSEVKESSYNNYIEEYKPVINAFEQWLLSQR